MAISIRNPEVKRLAQVLSERDKTNVTESIKNALERALRMDDREAATRKARLLSIAASCAALPDRDTRTQEDIIGYDNDGAFHHGD